MSYTKKQVCEITGLSLRAVQYYTERNLVVPEIDQGEGKGQTRKYSKANLFDFFIIKVLSDYQMSFSVIKNILKLIRCPMPIDKDKDDYYTKLDRSGVVGLFDQNEIKAESILIINLGAILNKIKKVELRLTGCHDFCERGPLIVIFPKNILYQEEIKIRPQR